jgi:hypothetical protein
VHLELRTDTPRLRAASRAVVTFAGSHGVAGCAHGEKQDLAASPAEARFHGRAHPA